MDDESLRELVVGAVAVIALLIASIVGLLRETHVVSLVGVYVVVAAGVYLFARSDSEPTVPGIVGFAVAVLVAAALPMTIQVGAFEGDPLQTANLVGRWALPIALTVPLGVCATRQQRRVVAGCLAVGFVAIVGSALQVFETTVGPWWGTATAPAAIYLVGVLAGYPGAVALSYRAELESAVCK